MDVSATDVSRGSKAICPIPSDDKTYAQPRTVATMQGWQWIVSAWQLFKTCPWTMMGFTIVCGLLMAVSNLMPPSSVFLTPFLMAGFVMAVAKFEQGGKLELNQLFACVKSHPIPLLTLGAIVFALSLACVLILVLGIALTLAAMESNNFILLGLASSVLLVGIVVLFISVFSMAHAPCLVVLNNQQPKQALINAIRAMLINLKPMTVYSLALTALFLLALIPAGLGLLVLWPLTIVSAYTSYRDIFAIA